MLIYVRVKPSSRQEKVERVDDTHFKIWVKEPAKEGKANIAVIKLLAKHLDMAPSRIELVSGHTSRDKVFKLL
ncbi:MAG: DUF167 domain-containing protein [Candidatus Colwellbacteria bacterium]